MARGGTLKAGFVVCLVFRYLSAALLPILRFMLDEMFQRNASKFAIFYVGIRKPKVAFSVFHFVLLYVFT